MVAPQPEQAPLGEAPMEVSRMPQATLTSTATLTVPQQTPLVEPTQVAARATAQLQADCVVAPQSEQAPVGEALMAVNPMPKAASPRSAKLAAQELCKSIRLAPQYPQRDLAADNIQHKAAAAAQVLTGTI